EIRLNHRADGRIARANELDEVNGALRVSGAFHINAQKIVETCCTLDNREHQTGAKFRVDVESKLRELARNVGLQFFVGDGLKNLKIGVAGALRVGSVSHILAQIVEAGHQAGVIAAPGRGEGLFQCLSSNETARHAARGRVGSDPGAEFLVCGKPQKCGPEYASQLSQ